MNSRGRVIRIALLASAKSIHTARWANALSRRGHEVHVFSLQVPAVKFDGDIVVHRLLVPGTSGYFLNAPFLRFALRQLKPDVVHAHYASGYGTLGRLCGARPYVLSVWGSDIYDVPNQGAFRRSLVVSNLNAADVVCSTSVAMASEAMNVSPEMPPPIVIPFGVNTAEFSLGAVRGDDQITIGTIKKLAPIYGIDTLILGFERCRAILMKTHKAMARQIRLRIVGEGSQRHSLEDLAAKTDCADAIQFTGSVSHDNVPSELSKLDVFVAVSRSESFGVAVIEASASGLPVVVSDVGGLPEVVRDGQTGIIVPPSDTHALANALVDLCTNVNLRRRLGLAGREFVSRQFDWHQNVSEMEAVYSALKNRPYSTEQ